MFAVDLDRDKGHLVEALHQGLIILLPVDVLELPSLAGDPAGVVHALETWFWDRGADAFVTPIAALKVVAVFIPQEHTRAGWDKGAFMARSTEIAMHGPDSPVARAFEDDRYPLPNTDAQVLKAVPLETPCTDCPVARALGRPRVAV